MAEGPILGIDLGTTNSAVGVVEAGFPILLADENGERLLPSAVHYPEKGGPVLVGHPALRTRALHPERTITSAKRLMGRRPGEVEWRPPYPVVRDDDGKVRVPVDGRELLPEEVATEVLLRLKAIAERALEQPVSRAVVTVPAYFNEAQRAATKRAAEKAGLTVERLLAEPTAAALAYGLDRQEGTTRVAVYDLGGGTFDLSILELRDGVFEVLATHGDTALGGDDVDRAIASWIREELELTTEIDSGMAVRILEAAEAAKIRLSSEDSVEIALPFLEGDSHRVLTLDRAQFEALAGPILSRTLPLAQAALADARIDKGELDAVLLVGGSTRIPQVRTLVEEFFGQEPNLSQHPDEAIALGATIQAGILSGAMRDIVLLDVTPLSLGIETFGGLMNVIIPRNTTIPVRAGELFTNAMAGQAAMQIRILQGEREMANDNWELGHIELPFAPGPKGSAKVGVQFEIDADGLLKVLARDVHTGKDHELEIRDTAVDVDDAKVEAMISESVEFAFEDMDQRIWTELQLKATELLPAVTQGLAQIGDDLPAEDRQTIQDRASAVEELLAAEERDPLPLKKAVAQLDDATQGLAVALVEQAMEKALERKLAD